MQLAKILLRLNESCDVHCRDITPAEILVFRAIHIDTNKVDCIKSVTVTGEVERSPAAEKARLESIYKPGLMDKLFPGAMPTLPRHFSEVGVSSLMRLDAPEPPVEPGAIGADEDPAPAPEAPPEPTVRGSVRSRRMAAILASAKADQ